MLQQLNSILQLPESCLVNKKITKAFFKRNFELTLSEKKLLDDFSIVIQIDWIASIKPENSNIASFTLEQFVFDEVVVIAVQAGENDFEKNTSKIIELIQKYIPYHILLCVYNSNAFIINASDKRINQNDSTKRTVEKHYITECINHNSITDKQQEFLNSLAFSNLDKHNLKTLFDSYTSRIIALQTAILLGTYTVRKTERSKQDVVYMDNIARLEIEVSSLLKEAKAETQIAVQVELNNLIQKKRVEIKKLLKMIEIG